MKDIIPKQYNLRAVLLIQAAFSFILLLCAIFSVYEASIIEENRLQADAGRMASRAALILALPVYDDDALIARQTILAEMDDTRLAGMVVYKDGQFLEGQRRNTDWESVPWDDLTPENSFESTKELIIEEQIIGEIIVYFSKRILEENVSAAIQNEVLRFIILFNFGAILQFLILQQVQKNNQYEEENLAPPFSESDFTLAELDNFLKQNENTPLEIISLAAKEDFTALQSLALPLIKSASCLKAEKLYYELEALIKACQKRQLATARLAESSAAALTEVLYYLKIYITAQKK